MDIKHSKPIAGQPLYIDIKVGNRWAHLIVILDGETLLEKRFDCPDPPCHERVSVQLSADAKGKDLLLEGKDPNGPRRVKAIVE